MYDVYYCIQSSGGSRFYVLNDWQSTYSNAEDVAPIPAIAVSDIMLKTMGILKVSLMYSVGIDQLQMSLFQNVSSNRHHLGGQVGHSHIKNVNCVVLTLDYNCRNQTFSFFQLPTIVLYQKSQALELSTEK